MPTLLQVLKRSVLAFLEVIGLYEGRRVDREAQLARFRLHHAEFRNLLTANNSFLETIADLERRRLGGAYFDPFTVERSALRASVDVFRMVESLNTIADDRYTALRNARDRITGEIAASIEHHRQPAAGLALDLDAIDAGHAAVVGGKMANLGELRSRLGLPTPDGFAVTTDAFRLLVTEGGLTPVVQGACAVLDSPEEIEAACAAVRERVLATVLPPALMAALSEAYDRFATRVGRAPAVAVRSSALGEDGHFSFAGQFLTLLGIGRDGLPAAYQQVVASLFSSDAAHYRLLHGIPHETAAMACGVLEMVDARAAGVAYSRDPNQPDSGEILVHAVAGLGVALVEGRTSGEVIRVRREPEPSVVGRVPGRQDAALYCDPVIGVREVASAAPVDPVPILPEAAALQLARWAVVLEDHFGEPQDIEWAMEAGGRLILLQSRPLQVAAEVTDNFAAKTAEGVVVLLDGGDVACPGVAAGPAVHLDENSDLETFPAGAVLVAPRSSPRFVRLMDRAAAIVTDTGSTTGHMASLSREFRVPALLNTRAATQVIRAGDVVTVDARRGRVYAGEVAELIASPQEREATGAPAAWVSRHPAHAFLEEAARLILPLNLADPHAPDFTPEGCRTLHDLARYVHEKSYEEMFRMGADLGDMRGVSFQLDVFLPVDLYIIDLGGGLVPGARGRKVKPAQIASAPLQALLNGMLDRRLPRFGPRPMDARGLVSVMLRHAFEAPEQERTFRDPCYALISDRYLNYTARVGYHFGVVDSYCGRTPNKNYITLHFRGGAADLVRRGRRTRAIAGILRRYGWRVELKADAVSGRFSKAAQEVTAGQLEMVGRLLQFARQMDVAMATERSVERVQEAFLSGNYSLAGLPPEVQGGSGG